MKDDKPIISWVPDYDIDTIKKRSFQKLERKNYVPIEERIQKELKEMKNREDELKNQRISHTLTTTTSIETLSKLRPNDNGHVQNQSNGHGHGHGKVDIKMANGDLQPNSKLLIQHWETKIRKLNEQ